MSNAGVCYRTPYAVRHLGKTVFRSSTEVEDSLLHALRYGLVFDSTCTMSRLHLLGVTWCQRVHGMMSAVLAMRSSVGDDDWASMLSLVWMAKNAFFDAMMQKTPSF